MSGDTIALIGAGLVVAGLAFALSAGLCALIIRWSAQLGFLDRPGGHKGHTAPVPLGGGLAIWLATVTMPLLGALLVTVGRPWLPEAIAQYASGITLRSGELALILGMATVVMLMGLADDRFTLSWQLRLGIQVGLATILAALGVRVTLFGPFAYPLFGGIVTVLWIVGVTNAFNFLDNMDGLAGRRWPAGCPALRRLAARRAKLVRAGSAARVGWSTCRVPGVQPPSRAAFHGRCREQFPGIYARRHDGGGDVLSLRCQSFAVQRPRAALGHGCAPL